MAFWKPVNTEIQSEITTFEGVNTGISGFNLRPGELTYSMNMDTRNYPAIASRYGYNASYPGLAPFTPLNLSSSFRFMALGDRNDEQIHAVWGNTWQYFDTATTSWVTLTTTLSTSAPGCFNEFVTATNRYTIYMNSTQKYIWDGASTVAVLGDSMTPNTSIFTVYKGRIYAVTNNTLQYSALNKTTDWTTADDSGSIVITNAKGPLTAICVYNDRVCVFTAYNMFELYGSGPANYELVSLQNDVGCISHRSIIEANGKLYWAGDKCIYEYNGAEVKKISEPVRQYLEAINVIYCKSFITAGAIGDYVYFSIPYSARVYKNNDLILKYDTRLGIWHLEDGIIECFVTIKNILYGAFNPSTYLGYAQAISGNIKNVRNTYNFTDDNRTINWSFITKPFTHDTISGRKTLQKIYTLCDISTNNNMYISYSTVPLASTVSEPIFTWFHSATGSSDTQNIQFKISSTSIQDSNYYRLKFNGTGKATIYQVQQDLRVKKG